MILPRFITINVSLDYRYSNALHMYFHSEMHKLIHNGIDIATINASEEMFAEWKRLVELEADIDEQMQANQETQQLNKIDEKRDTCITYVFQTVRNEMLSPIPARKEAAESLLFIVNKYKGLQTEAYDVESIHIMGLIESLRTPAETVHCTTLGLDEVINLLETTNNQYIAIKEQRTTVRTDAILPKSKKVRRQTNSVYSCICEHIQATHLISTDAEIRSTIEALVAKMNQFIVETKTTYHQMEAAGKKT